MWQISCILSPSGNVKNKDLKWQRKKEKPNEILQSIYYMEAVLGPQEK
jgi:hypothetical protein